MVPSNKDASWGIIANLRLRSSSPMVEVFNLSMLGSKDQ